MITLHRSEQRGRAYGARGAWVVGLAVCSLLLIPLSGCWWYSVWQDAMCWSQSYADWQAEVETWPDLAVRIVNNTDATARVSLGTSSIWDSGCGGILGDISPDPNYNEAASDSLLVAANGTATGTIKCGEIVGVTVSAPYDLSSDDYYYGYSDYSFGLYLDEGNVRLSGVGVSSESNFTGDTVSLYRYVRQAEDNLDCTADTLVITIESLGTARVVNPETGEIILSGTPGTGTVNIE